MSRPDEMIVTGSLLKRLGFGHESIEDDAEVQVRDPEAVAAVRAYMDRLHGGKR